MLFKILHGDESRISLDITPFHEGWAYVTHAGNFYIDMNVGTVESPNNQRIKLNAKNADTLGTHTADEFILEADIDDILAQAQISSTQVTHGENSLSDIIDAMSNTDLSNYYTKDEVNNTAVVVLAEAQADASNKAAVVLAEVQTDLKNNYYTKTEVDTVIENVEVDSTALNSMLEEVLV